VPTGFGALQGHGIGASVSPGTRLGDRGRRTNDVNIALFQLAQLRRRDHAKRKHRHRRPCLAQRGELVGIARRPLRRQAGANVEALACHQRIELLACLRYGLRVDLEGIGQYEQADRVRPVTEYTDLRGLIHDRLRFQIAGTERTEATRI